MAYNTISSETLRLTPNKVSCLAFMESVPNGLTPVQATLRNESGGNARFNCVKDRNPTPSGEEGSNLLRVDGELDIIGSEDLVNARFIPSDGVNVVIRVTYSGTGEV